AQGALVAPPTGNLFKLAAGFTRHAQVKVANQTQLMVKIAVTERSEDRLAQAQRERRQIRKDQPDLELAAVSLQRSAQAQLPAAFNPRQVLVQIHAREQRDGGRVRYFSIEQRGKAMPTGHAIEQIIRTKIRIGIPVRRPLRELFQRTLPKDLVLLADNR